MDKRLHLVKRLSHRLRYDAEDEKYKGYTITSDGVGYLTNRVAIYAIYGVENPAKDLVQSGNHTADTWNTIHRGMLRYDVNGDHNFIKGPVEAWEKLLTGTRNVLKIAAHEESRAVWFSALRAEDKRNVWAYPFEDRETLSRAFNDHRLEGHVRVGSDKAGIAIGVTYLRDMLLIARCTGAKVITMRWYGDDRPTLIDIGFYGQAIIGPVVKK